jgi:hypothetical protein
MIAVFFGCPWMKSIGGTRERVLVTDMLKEAKKKICLERADRCAR